MNRTIALIILAFSSLFNAAAQDIITLRSGEEFTAHIIRLNPKDVTFFVENTSDTLSLMRDEITKLQYKTGTIIYLSEIKKPEISNGPIIDSLYLLGVKDANRYYKGYKPAATGTLITSFFIPLGLIPAIACSSSPPSVNSLGYRDQQLIEDPGYWAGYNDQAYSIKKKKVWRNFGVGTGVTICYIIVVAVVNSFMIY